MTGRAVLKSAVEPAILPEYGYRRAVIVGRVSEITSAEKQTGFLISWMRPRVAIIFASTDHDGTILLRCSQQIDIALVLKEIAPESVRNVSNISPGFAVVAGTVDAGKVLLAFVVQWAAWAEVVMRGKEIAAVQADNAWASEIGPGCWVLVLDLIEFHVSPPSP